MNMLIRNIAKRLSSLRSLTIFRSALVDVSLVSCLNSQHIGTELRIGMSGNGCSQNNASTDARFRLIGQDIEWIPAGSHLVSPRKFYVHHGIYLGNGKVAHYSGLSGSLRAGPIEVTDLKRFANGRSTWFYQEQAAFTNDEIVVRARSRIGESQYKVFSNNCEHFCSWCITGTSHSAQVVEFLHFPFRLIGQVFARESGLVA
ncbi:lecithin retinol acyltransferase family protein [Pseudomonas petrae]|uniref:Lecithin retinol acyltransferase family protein n=1 Tax=Pseudomonas petrae TaxID=2912190 RepID=A0ABS9I1I1_9PSED|nr:lecithin retinol acyltransferase family protein [Pseudomonas petrae]MCF7532487.1 lecithin retinol acyltransferase family protein [Pseudomonas petrae]MCF7536121.1 lecithin retinol acyltransferase family protein [Pseudomonas petrae]MCF7541655.1 lecithin retinol acyltransferase family protein [Pseudomonas petrae]MCF7557498.1 lecithin retinol acyltransferase family protein [Pseudomonas petrae]